MRERMGTAVTMVIDVNSAKHGKYLPGTGLQVQSPAEALRKLAHGSPIYVMNSNYLEEIKVMTNNRYHYLVVDQ